MIVTSGVELLHLDGNAYAELMTNELRLLMDRHAPVRRKVKDAVKMIVAGCRLKLGRPNNSVDA